LLFSILDCTLYDNFHLFFLFYSSSYAGELLLQGPVFIKEPSNSIFPVDSEDKKITLNCEARGNPSPHYRYSGKVDHGNKMW
jgi:hypothetical protein